MTFYLDKDATVTDAKNMLKILDTEDDDLLARYIQTAEIQLQNAVGTSVEGFYKREEVIPLYKTAVLSMVGTFYTYRIAISEAGTNPVHLTYDSILWTLRGLYDVAVADQKEGDVSGHQ